MARLSDLFVSIKADDTKASRTILGIRRQLTDVDKTKVSPKITLPGDLESNLAGFQRKLAALSKSQVSLNVNSATVKAEIGTLEKQLAALRTKKTTLPTDLQDTAQREIDALERDLLKAQRKQTQIPLKLERVGSQISAVEGQLNAAGGKFSKAGTAAGAKFGNGFGSRVKDVLAGIGIASFSGAVVGGLGKAIKTAGDFDQTMRTVGVTLGEGEKGVKSLTALAVDMGAKTSFSAKGASDAMLELAKGGLSSAQIEAGALNSTLTLATAGGLELGDAATYMVNGLNSFKISAKDSNSVAAALAGAANASTASVESLGQGLAQASAQAATAGLSLQETVSALAALDNAGIKGSDAGTSLKTFLTRLVPTTLSAVQSMEDYGLVSINAAKASKFLASQGIKPLSKDQDDLNLQLKDYAVKITGQKGFTTQAVKAYLKIARETGSMSNAFFDASGNIKSMSEVSGILQGALKGQTKEQQIATLSTLFGSDASRAAGVIASTGAKKIDEYSKAANDQAQAQNLAKSATAGFSGALERVQGAAETFGIQVGTKLLPPLSKFLDVLSSKVIPALSSLFGFLVENKTAVGAVAAVLGGAVGALTAISIATKVWAGAQLLLNLALTANPIGIVVVAIGGLVAGLIYAYKHSESFRKVVDTVGRALKIAFVVALASVKVAIAAIVKAFIAVRDTTVEVWATVKGAVVGAWQGIVAFFSGAGGAVSGAVGAVWEKVKTVTLGVLTAVGTAVSDAWGKIVTVTKVLLAPVVAVVKTIIGGFVTVFKVAFTAIGVLNVLFWGAISKVTKAAFGAVKDRIITPVWNAVSAIFSKVQGTVSRAFSKFWDGIKSIASAAFTFYRDRIVLPVWNKVSAIFTSVMGAIRSAFSKWWDNLKNNASAAFNFVLNRVISPIWTRIRTIFSTVMGVIRGAFVAWWTNLRQTAQNAFNTIAGVVSSVFQRVRNTFSTIQGAIRGTWSTFWGGIKSTAGNAMDAVRSKISGVLGRIKDSFSTVKSNIRTIWDGIKNVVSAPIEWVKNNVYNRPLVPVWNRVAQLVNGPKLSAYARGGIAEAERYANGGTPFGVRPGYTPGRDTHTIQVGGGEAIMRPEWTRAVGAEYVAQANKAARTGGAGAVRDFMLNRSDPLAANTQPVDAFAGGGIVGWIKSTVGGAVGGIKDLAGTLKDFAIGGLKKAANAVLAPVRGLIRRNLSGAAVRETVGNVANKALDLVVGKIGTEDDKAATTGGGIGPIDVNNPRGRTTFRGGTFTNLMAANLKRAEQIAKVTIPAIQGGFRPTTSYSGTSHQGDAIDTNVNYAALRALRQVGIAAGDRTGLGNWAPHIHAVPLPGHGFGAGSAVWQAQDYLRRGGAKQSPRSPWGLIDGAVVKGGRGGTYRQIGEGPRDELVMPLPRNWKSGDGDLKRLIELLEARGSGDVNINLGGIHNPLPETASQTTNRVLQRVSSLGLV